MAAQRIGRGRCPVCASERAQLTVSAKGLAVITCNTCNFQGFARSDNSDARLRSLLIEREGDPAPAPAPTTAPDPKPAPAPAASGLGWGMLAGG